MIFIFDDNDRQLAVSLSAEGSSPPALNREGVSLHVAGDGGRILMTAAEARALGSYLVELANAANARNRGERA